jgi:hypothetical protein
VAQNLQRVTNIDISAAVNVVAGGHRGAQLVVLQSDDHAQDKQRVINGVFLLLVRLRRDADRH